MAKINKSCGITIGVTFRKLEKKEGRNCNKGEKNKTALNSLLISVFVNCLCTSPDRHFSSGYIKHADLVLQSSLPLLIAATTHANPIPSKPICWKSIPTVTKEILP